MFLDKIESNMVSNILKLVRAEIQGLEEKALKKNKVLFFQIFNKFSDGKYWYIRKSLTTETKVFFTKNVLFKLSTLGADPRSPLPSKHSEGR
jgi:hypothetical protein